MRHLFVLEDAHNLITNVCVRQSKRSVPNAYPIWPGTKSYLQKQNEKDTPFKLSFRNGPTRKPAVVMIHDLLAEKLGDPIGTETDFAGANWVRSIKPVERGEKKGGSQGERDVWRGGRSRHTTKQQNEPGNDNDAQTADKKPECFCQAVEQRLGGKEESSIVGPIIRLPPA
jgi:hypothetical protein